MLSAIVRAVRLASLAICVIVAASFLIFAVQQTKAASGRQTEAIAGPVTGRPEAPAGKGTVHRVIDDAAEAVTSPFSGLLSTGSEWTFQGARLLLTLAIYGFGVGYLARVVRVRV